MGERPIVGRNKERRDLSSFRELSENGKVPWAERAEVVYAQFPSVVSLDWKKVFDQDPAILGRIIGDIIKVDQSSPGRPGKRAKVETGQAENRLRQLTGQDFSIYPFPEAFRALIGSRSIRSVAKSVGISHTYAGMLLRGETHPKIDLLETIAARFKKSPEYWTEYRMAYVVGVLSKKLEDSPEASAYFFQKFQNMVK